MEILEKTKRKGKEKSHKSPGQAEWGQMNGWHCVPCHASLELALNNAGMGTGWGQEQF